MAEDLGDKTEAPSGKRLADARDRGEVPRSMDLASAAQLLVICITLQVFSRPLMDGMGRSLKYGLDFADTGNSLSIGGVQETLTRLAMNGAWAVMPILGIAVVATYLAHAGQFGFVLTAKPLMPNLDKLNPIAGIQKLFGISNAGKSGVSVLKVALVFVVGASYVWKLLPRIAGLPSLTMTGAMKEIATMTIDLVIWLLLILLLLGAVDYFFQRWSFMRGLKMTKQEVKDERKDMDGDPTMKGKRLRRAREIAMQRISRDVPKADVIVTNPTHFAVAIQYDPATMPAPKVVAKGADLLALRIRQVASANAIPIVERPPLARAIFYGVDVGQEISPEHYQAVAEILAYVYRLEKQAA